MSCHRFFTELRLQCDYAAQDVLGGFRLAAVVGGGGHNPDFISVVVDRLPQRLVLIADRFSVWRGRPLTHEILRTAPKVAPAPQDTLCGT